MTDMWFQLKKQKKKIADVSRVAEKINKKHKPTKTKRMEKKIRMDRMC